MFGQFSRTSLRLLWFSFALQRPVDGKSILPIIQGKETQREKPIGFMFHVPNSFNGSYNATWVNDQVGFECDVKSCCTHLLPRTKKKWTMLLIHKIRILRYWGIKVLGSAAEPRANATCDFTHRCIADCRFFHITWCITRMVLYFGQGSINIQIIKNTCPLPPSSPLPRTS